MSEIGALRSVEEEVEWYDELAAAVCAERVRREAM